MNVNIDCYSIEYQHKTLVKFSKVQKLTLKTDQSKLQYKINLYPQPWHQQPNLKKYHNTLVH